MDLKGEYLIPAPKDKVWEELNNPESLKNAIKIIDKAQDCGVSAIKIQTYTPDTITLKTNFKY